MNGIGVGIPVLLINGIPQCLLTVFALFVFTRTKFELKKYLLLSLAYAVAVFLVRLLPITLGVNTILSMFILILIFQFTYRDQLSRVIWTIASTVIIIILVAISEELNMLLLTLIFGQAQAEALFNSADELTRSIYTIPSTVFLAISVFLGYFIVKKIDKRKQEHGETGEKTSE